MRALEFVVKGSRGDFYTVRAFREGGNLTMTCTCRAGEVGIHCKHRLSLLMGDVSRLISENEEDVERLRELHADSDVEHYVEQLHAAEEELKVLQAKVKALRKALGRSPNKRPKRLHSPHSVGFRRCPLDGFAEPSVKHNLAKVCSLSQLRHIDVAGHILPANAGEMQKQRAFDLGPFGRRAGRGIDVRNAIRHSAPPTHPY